MTKTENIMFLVLAALSVAAEPVELNDPPATPEYLVPVSPHGRERQAAVERELGGRQGLGTMICIDLPDNDIAVSAWTKQIDKKDVGFLTYLEISRHYTTVPKTTFNVDVAIDSDFAVAIQRAWAAVLLKTRYPVYRYLGADGWEAEFSVWIKGIGGAYGKSWSPSQGLPKKLSDAGFALIDYCKTSERERPAKRERILRGLEELAQSATK